MHNKKKTNKFIKLIYCDVVYFIIIKGGVYAQAHLRTGKHEHDERSDNLFVSFFARAALMNERLFYICVKVCSGRIFFTVFYIY